MLSRVRAVGKVRRTGRRSFSSSLQPPLWPSFSLFFSALQVYKKGTEPPPEDDEEEADVEEDLDGAPADGDDDDEDGDGDDEDSDDGEEGAGSASASGPWEGRGPPSGADVSSAFLQR